MFGTILLTVVTVMHIYIIWRAATVPFIRRHVSGKVLIGTGIVLWTVFFLSRMLRHGTGTPAMVLEFLGMNWMAIVFLMTVSMLTVDIVTLFGFVLRRFALFLRGCALVAGVLFSAIALVQGLRPPVVQNYDVNISGLPREMDGKVIVAMSDLHLGTLIGKNWLKARVVQVNTLEPDLVLLLGDIFEGRNQPDKELIEVFHRISAPMGMWAVLGNHEFHGRDDKNDPLLHYDGIKVLSNSRAELRPGFILAGVDDLTRNHRSGLGGDPVSRALAGRPEGATVFLSHTPWYADRIAAEGVGLMLSGHTHGGQIWPFGYLVQRIYPLLGGRYEVNGMTVIVCRGTGTWGPRMRLWRPGEILRITLHADAST